jgi:hypothetical protein
LRHQRFHAHAKLLGGVLGLGLEEGWGTVALEEKQLHYRAFASGALHQGLRQVSQLLARVSAGALGLLHESRRPARRTAIQLVQQVLLALEVAVDRPLGHTRFPCDLGGGRRLVAPRTEELERGAHQSLASEIGRRHRHANLMALNGLR